MPRLVSLLLATSLMATAPAVVAHDIGETPGVIHVTASASANATPDRAMMTGGVVTRAQTARLALSQNSAKMDAVFAALQDAGVDERDIATSSLSVQPQYNYEVRDKTGQPQLSGYQASNQVTVTTSDLEGVGPLIDTLIEAGLNTVNNVNFVVKDQEAAQNKARAEAIVKARSKAQSMALAAGVRLGRLLSLTEGSQPGPMPMRGAIMEVRSVSYDAAPTSPGQREISQTVTLSYAID